MKLVTTTFFLSLFLNLVLFWQQPQGLFLRPHEQNRENFRGERSSLL